MLVNARTKALGLLGNPVEHSFSPVIHNSVSESLNQNYVYLAHDVVAENLGDAVKGLNALGYRGVNVTVPHKQNVIMHLTEISKEAKIIGAVNTILFDNNRLIGYNTDCYGFTKMLEDEAINLSGKSILILGAGGAARAVVAACVLNHSSEVHICSRDVNKSIEYIKSFDKNIPNKILWKSTTYGQLKETSSAVDIVVNCTPLGMHPKEGVTPIDPIIFKDSCVLVDLIYNPEYTEFLTLGIKQGKQVVNGLGMLIHQALESYRIWTGNTESADFVKNALKNQGII